MAKYNTFVVYDCKMRRTKLVTSSARKSKEELRVGVKIEVWNENQHIETIYAKHSREMDKYIQEEKRYIAAKQHKAEIRNKERKKKHVRHDN